MRHIIIIFILTISTFKIVSGQDNTVIKGASILSGSFSYAEQNGNLTSSANNSSTSTFGLSFNNFVFNNLFLGGALSLINMTSNSDKLYEIGFGPQLGYAIGSTKNKSYPYFFVGYRYYNWNEETGINSTNTSKGNDLIVGAGIIITVYSHLGLGVEANYQIMKLDKGSINMFSVGISLLGLFNKTSSP